MVEKDTQKFERESFKDRILREIEEANRSLDDVASETGFGSKKTGNQSKSIPTPRPKPKKIVPNEPENTSTLKAFDRGERQEKAENQEKIDTDSNIADIVIDEDELLKKLSRPLKAAKSDDVDSSIVEKTSKSRKRFAADGISKPSSESEPFSEIEKPRQRRSRSAKEKQSDKALISSEKPVSLIEDTQELVAAKRASRKETENAQRSNKKKSKNLAGKIIAVLVLILLVVGGASAFLGYRYVKNELKPLSTSKTTKSVKIPEGAASKEIGQILEDDGIIKNATAFQYYTKFKSLAGFQAGYYNLAPNMTLNSIAKTLQKGGTDKPVVPILGKVTFPEGYTISQMAEKITDNVATKSDKDKTPFTKADFLKVVTDDAFIAKMKAAYPDLFASLPAKDSGVKYQLEGYLFPATYEYTKKSTTESIVEQMIAYMNQNLKPYYATIQSKSLSVNEVLSIAALTEKEANNDSDRRNVAQVFYNRINSGMTLGSNISILYAENKLGQKTSLAEDAAIDTGLDSPYNLYMNLGFGPGPVTNPSLSSIKAAIEPTDNNDLYFVADVTTGKVYFSETQEEQDANVQKYVNDKLSSGSSESSAEGQ
ncbi:endolytic transglycosylase MltG [Pseudolactococcus insecticola]|uniref:Endolytic murein transglycosylase n=1 Tax=Pseudolactococcus insecticola TaxID=2709158 RepID=A0A6A0B7F5_9LACT|nr:endolytic transglycosylase MltG [Lactococcus insecticola]GFH41202.1 aminodeoxychorismate lyase [Lactococcus insecticola]